MPNVLSYHVYDSESKQWIDDEDRLVNSFHASAAFNNLETANDAMERTGADYVFACMGSV
jgi:hypothetical protein